jgi:3-isopropylmalate/(R)-2-methylmalate dehydratase small subunit
MEAFRGRIWKFGDDINTDLIAPLGPVTDEERRQRCFSANRPGWSSQVQPGDIIIGGKNFGTGSSRPAAQVLTKLGVAGVVAESVNGLFMRNSINFGLPILVLPGVTQAFDEPDVAEIDLTNGEVRNLETGKSFSFEPMPQMFLDILGRGGLMQIMRDEGLIVKVDPSRD